LQLWKTLMIMWIRIDPGKIFRENIKTSVKGSLGHNELQQHKPWFDDECSH
jgi:hypothetical protein